MDALNETTLIEGARRGDRASQEAIVRLYERRVYGLVLRLVENREDARDILQETMIKALTSINRYEGTYPFTSWLFRIATNKALDFLRRRKLEFRIFQYESAGCPGEGGAGAPGAGDGAERGAGIDDVADPGPLPDATASDRLDLAVVERCLDRLAPKYRTVLHLRYRDDLAYKEIARVLSIPIGTVKILLHRGHAELKQQVIKELGQEGGSSL
jgi:RNA polymerase sigma-70 factor (ECF subfamily)